MIRGRKTSRSVGDGRGVTSGSQASSNILTIRVENTGRNTLSTDIAQAGMFMAMDLPWRLLLPGYQVSFQPFHHTRPDSPPLLWAQADIGSHDGDERMRAPAEPGHDDHLAFQIANGAHVLVAKQLEAAHVDAGQDDDGIVGLDPPQPARGGIQRQIDCTRSEWLVAGGRDPDVLDIREPLSLEKFLGNLDRSLAEGQALHHPESRRLRRRLRGHRSGRQAEQPRRACHRQPAQEASSRPAFSLLGPHEDLLSLPATVRKVCRRECKGVGKGCQSSRQVSCTCGPNTVGLPPHRGKGSHDSVG